MARSVFVLWRGFLGKGPSKIHRRIHEPDVRQRLREVSKMGVFARVDLLREQPERRGTGEHAFEQLFRFLYPAEGDKVVDQPEGADSERRFAARQSVIGRDVPVDQSAGHKTAHDRVDGGFHAFVPHIDEADHRQQQVCRIQYACSIKIE